MDNGNDISYTMFAVRTVDMSMEVILLMRQLLTSMKLKYHESSMFIFGLIDVEDAYELEVLFNKFYDENYPLTFINSFYYTIGYGWKELKGGEMYDCVVSEEFDYKSNKTNCIDIDWNKDLIIQLLTGDYT